MSENDKIDLPTTWPWCAPETEGTWEYSFEAARMADTFSFGMVCLWALFDPVYNKTTCDGVVDLLRSTHWIERLRSDGNLVETAVRLTESIDANEMRNSLDLSSFFQNALASDPQDRFFSERAMWEIEDPGKSRKRARIKFRDSDNIPYSARFQVR